MANQGKTEAQVTPPAAEAQAPSLLDSIVSEMKVRPAQEGYDEARSSVQALIGQLVGRRSAGERIDRKVIDVVIAEIDRRIGKQVDHILHHPDFQKIESAWRGLKLLVDRTDFRENIRISLLQATKQELLDDFEDATEIPTSGLYRQVYTAEYGQFGGKPYGAMVCNYQFGLGNSDITLLRHLAAVGAMAHAPVIAAASPTLFGAEEKDFSNLPYLKDLEGLFEAPQYTKWKGLRETEDARYLGLVMPRFLVRPPFKAEEGRVRTFAYDEDVSASHEHYMWSNAAFAFATRLADSFAKFRWCPNIIGPQAGGTVDDLPIHLYEAMGETKAKIPTEVLISERREYELSEQGLIALTMRKDSDNAAFFSANSLQKPKFFGTSEEAKAAELNYRLGTQLPYIFMITRVAHYIKVLQREHIGSWKTAGSLQEELSRWINQFVTDNIKLADRKPFNAASIEVEDVPGNAGWYKVGMKLSPHFKYMGANFTLSLVGKLDKN
ncbi:MAG: type VI secretion system contractile sheath large subunit [Proteobacteria bacterium]|nr:type VI secretion system contractile sheath large subunit [Pseudomonadota bacterium]